MRIGLRLQLLVSLVTLCTLAVVAAFSRGYVLFLLTLWGVWTIAALGVTVLYGWSRLLSFAQAGFVAIGAYTTALLLRSGLMFWTAVPAAIVLTSLVALGIGLVLCRLRGSYFALATFGLAEITRQVINNSPGVTGGPQGFKDIPPIPLSVLGQHASFILIFAVLSALVIGFHFLESRALGRMLKTIPGGDFVVEVTTGRNALYLKVSSFAVAAGLAAIAGALYAPFIRYLSPDAFGLQLSLQLITMAVVGGLSSVGGAIVGGALVTLLPELLRGLRDYYLLIYGVSIVGILLTFPKGIIGLMDSFAHRRVPADARSRHFNRPRVIALKRQDLVQLESLLEISAVSKRFGGLAAVDRVSMSVKPRTIHAIIGPNGAGKTTLINVLTGLYRPDDGAIRFSGHEIAGLPAHRIHRLGIARTFQTIRLFTELTVRENVQVSLGYRGFWDQMIVGENGHVRLSEDDLLSLVGLSALGTQPAQNLSYGQRRLLEVARALASKPRLLVLDEPVAGLTFEEARELMSLLGNLKSAGLTVLLIEHNMGVVMSVSDWITVLDSGRVIAEGPPGEVQQSKRVLEAYLGEVVQ